MPLDLLTFGEALVEVMRTEVDQPLHQPALFTGPYPSGAPFIFAVQSARLGASVGAIGSVGNDAFGRCLTDQLTADGVDTQGIHILPDYPTGVAFVAYNGDGSRDFVFHIRGAAAGQLSPNLLNDVWFEDLKCLHLMGSTLSIHVDALQTGLRAIELAHQAGAIISFDPNLRLELMSIEQARIAFTPFMQFADVILPTQDELCSLTETANISDAASKLLDEKPERVIVITQGKLGCRVISQTIDEQVTGYSVDEVDPTGAGDCFDAGFLVRYLAGDSPVESARYANACGALAVTQQGPMAGAYHLAYIESFMQGNTN